MEEAAKWQLARTRCNLDTLLQETPQARVITNKKQQKHKHQLIQTQAHTNTQTKRQSGNCQELPAIWTHQG